MRKNLGKNGIDKFVEKAASILLVWLAAFFAGSSVGQVAEWRSTASEEMGEESGEEKENEMRQESGEEKENEVRQESGEEKENEGRQESGEEKENEVRQENGEEKENKAGQKSEAEKNYIRWVDFNVTKEAMQQAYEYDVDTHGTEHPLNWIELLAYLGAKYGGDFKNYKAADMTSVAELVAAGDTTMAELTRNMKYYEYYLEAYEAVLGGMVGEYQIEMEKPADGAGEEKQEESAAEDGTGEGKQAETLPEDGAAEESREFAEQEPQEAQKNLVTCYGLKAFHPIAKGFPYSDYDDFGVSRSYGYKREHLGHDMMGQVGTPIIAVESGYVAALGWNQYGGWRIGINSFDGKRYYYYAHLRQNFPYAKWLQVGSIVEAGDVIGYMGRTGYSSTENVNNIDTYHLHFGLQLIFDESQRDGTNQIWVSPYELVRFLYQNQCEAQRNDETKEWTRVTRTWDSAVREYQKSIRQ